MVPVAGIEPALPKKRHFECRVSTNSTTLAKRGFAPINITAVTPVLRYSYLLYFLTPAYSFVPRYVFLHTGDVDYNSDFFAVNCSYGYLLVY